MWHCMTKFSNRATNFCHADLVCRPCLLWNSKFDYIWHNYPLFFPLFPHLLWTLVVTDNSPFHGLVIFTVFSAQYLPAVWPLLFRHVQTSSTFSSFLHVSTLLWSSLFRVWDYDDRLLGRDFPFSCLGYRVICSFK